MAELNQANLGHYPSMPPVLDIGNIPELPSVAGIAPSVAQRLESETSRFGIGVKDIVGYIDPSESLTGFGNGGSESLVLFITKPGGERVVRKVCSLAFSGASWDPNGTGTMSPPAAKANLQVEYLQGLPEPVQPYFPAVRDVRRKDHSLQDGSTAHELIYDLSMVDGIEVTSFVAQNKPTAGVVAHLHREILRCLANRVHTHRRVENSGPTVETAYLDKITKRLDMCQEDVPDIFKPLIDSKSIVINGRPHRNIRELLAFFRRPEVSRLLEPPHHNLVMGDTNTENVMITNTEPLLAEAKGKPDFTYDDLGIMFLDPRAIGYNSSGANTTDDPMYDNKPLHNSLGHYDIIHGEHFDLGLDLKDGTPGVTMRAQAGNPYEKSYRGIDRYFKYIMDGWDIDSEQVTQEDPNWLLRFTFVMGTHFAAMPPFHLEKSPDGTTSQDPQVQKRAIAVYCQGIKWLNRAYDMVTGHRQGIYGVIAPDPGVAPRLEDSRMYQHVRGQYA